MATDEKVVAFSKKDQARGRGRNRLKAERPKERRQTEPSKTEEVDEPIPQNVEIPLDKIDVGENPRQLKDDDADKELMASIKKHGILQPIRVRPIGGRYQVVAGERRLAAAQEAKLKTIPAFIATPTDDQAYQQALVENLQRQNLNPIDEAKALLRLLADGKMTQKQVGAIIGKSQSYVANAIRLLETDPVVQEALSSGQLNVASAKALASLPPERQQTLASRAVKGEVNSKDIEAAAADVRRQESEKTKRAELEKQMLERYSSGLAAGVKSKAIPKKGTVTVADWVIGDLDKLTVPKGITVVRMEHGTMNRRDEALAEFCDCKAVYMTFDARWDGGRQVYADEPTFYAYCVIRDHLAAMQKAAREAQTKRERDAASKIKALKKELEPNLTASATALSDEGYRLLIYSLLMGRPQLAAAFCKKAGVEHPKVEQYATSAHPESLWQAATEADLEQVVALLSTMLVDTFVIDVYRAPEYDLERQAHVRQWFVDRFGMTAEFAWGGREKELQRGEFAPKPEPVADAGEDEATEQPETAEPEPETPEDGEAEQAETAKA